jgi:DNA-binding response OmpR family regulator
MTTSPRFVQNVAEQPGHAVQVTTDRPAFMHAYDTLKPSTIILDMVLPGMDGNELIRWLAEGRCFARLIMITGDTPNHAKHAKVLAECQGLRLVITLNKPIEGSKLNTVLGSQASP